jgi:hypothetical protein
MNVKQPLRRLTLVLALALASATSVAQAASPSEQAVAKKLARVEQIWNVQDGKQLVAELYTPTTEITGEGMPEVARGTPALTALVQRLMEGATSTKISLNKFMQLGPDHGWSWVTWDIVPRDPKEKPFKMKSLLVWEKYKGDWRIVGDMFATGEIPASK